MASSFSTSEMWDREMLRPYLEAASRTKPPASVTLQEFKQASHYFPMPFPKHTARVHAHVNAGKSEEKLTQQINSAYPLIHERCIPLLAGFLHYKKSHGSNVEKSLYENMDLVNFVDRLLRKRPVTFFAKWDHYLLRDGTKGKGGFEKIGTDVEVPPLCLKDYLSYDEIKVSALLSVSSKSFFINDGIRKNKGVPGRAGTFQEDGVIMGMVGARLKKMGYMEWQDCVVTERQNFEGQGYGSLDGVPCLQHVWARLWGGPLPEWSRVTNAPIDGKFFKVNDTLYLNVDVYKQRMQLGAETHLAEAKARARAVGLKAYIHVVGLGLGVWRACHEQDAMFADAWGEALKVMDTSDIAHVDFSWIGASTCLGVGNGQVFPGTGVKIHFSKRSLHDPVPSGTLLVVNYAWDGNSLPGNEYWIGKLCSTGDGAAACSSGVAELHNVHINSNVCGANLHVAGSSGIVHIAEYATKFLSEERPGAQTNKKIKTGL